MKYRIKLIIGMMIIMLMCTINRIEQLEGKSAPPEITSQNVSFQVGTGVYINHRKYVALESKLVGMKVLSEELVGEATSDHQRASTLASNFAGAATDVVAERAIIAKSELPSLEEMKSVSSAGQLLKYYRNVDRQWWLKDTQMAEGYMLGGIMTSDGRYGVGGTGTKVEKAIGNVCSEKVLSGPGMQISTSPAWPDPGRIPIGTVVYSKECPIWATNNGNVYGHQIQYDGENCVDGKLDPGAGWSRFGRSGYVEWGTTDCATASNPLKANVCYNTSAGFSLIWKVLPDRSNFNVTSELATVTGHGQGYKNCAGPVSGTPQNGIRPTITLDPQSYIIASFPISETHDTTVSSTLKNYDQPNNEMVAGTDYKFRLFDSTQQVTKVSKPATTQDNLFAVKDNKVQVELGTTEVTLGASVKGTHNYISAMATDKGGSTDLYGKIGTGTAAANSITLDISKIMDTSVVGEKQVNLYSEQINPNTYSDLVSSTPLTVTFEVLPPKSDQILALDENNATEIMYGDEITLKAYVNKENPDLGWATAADTNTIFALVGDDAVNHVNIVKQSFDSTTGIAEVTLKAISGEDAQVQLSVNKKGSHEQRYNDASEVLTPKITIKKREITVTPKKTIMKVGDTYPPAWQFDAKMTDLNNKTAALVAGDTLPYTVETLGWDSGTPDGPTLDGNIIKDENSKKKWRLSVVDKTAAEVAAFEKNYLVTRNHYDAIKNKKSTLEISNIPYEGMEFIEHPDDVVTLVDETFTFSAKATYPTNDVNGSPITDVENTIQYTWQQRADVNAPWEDVKDGTQNVTYENGEAIFTYTRTAGASESTMQYRCIATNARDREDGVTAFSKEAGLTVRTEPVAFIQVPQEVELVEKDGKIAQNKPNKEKEAIKLYDYVNEVSGNTETTPQIPTGTFEISTDEFFYLTANGDPEKQHDKKFKVSVYRSNETPLTKENTVLTTLDYTTKKQDTFILRTPIDRMKKEGTYKGIMTFIVRYVKASGGS